MDGSVMQRSAALVRQNVEESPQPIRTIQGHARQHLEHGGMGRGDDERPHLSYLEGARDRGRPWRARAEQAEPSCAMIVCTRGASATETTHECRVFSGVRRPIDVG